MHLYLQYFFTIKCLVVFKSFTFSLFTTFFFPSHSYAGLSLRYSLTLGSFHSAGQQMRRKLMAILRLKCHAVFVDLKVREIIILKVFKILHMLTMNTEWIQKVYQITFYNP